QEDVERGPLPRARALGHDTASHGGYRIGAPVQPEAGELARPLRRESALENAPPVRLVEAAAAIAHGHPDHAPALLLLPRGTHLDGPAPGGAALDRLVSIQDDV